MSKKNTENTYTTRSGVTLHLKPISPLLIQKVNAAIPDPVPPVYKTQGIDGEITFFHDAESIKDPETTREEKLAWRNYLKEQEQVAIQRRDKLMEVVFARGVEFEMPDDDSWVAEQEMLGIEVPQNPISRKVHYLTTEVLVSQQEIQDVMNRVMRLITGATEEEMQAVRETFRPEVSGETAGGLVAETEFGRDAEGVDV